MTYREASGYCRQAKDRFGAALQKATPVVVGGNPQNGYEYGVRLTWIASGQWRVVETKAAMRRVLA